MYVEYSQVLTGNKWFYVGGNSRVKVEGFNTCKLSLHGGSTLDLRDVLYALGI